eukprot:48002_1
MAEIEAGVLVDVIGGKLKDAKGCKVLHATAATVTIEQNGEQHRLAKTSVKLSEEGEVETSAAAEASTSEPPAEEASPPAAEAEEEKSPEEAEIPDEKMAEEEGAAKEDKPAEPTDPNVALSQDGKSEVVIDGRRVSGKVKRWNVMKGFGFIHPDEEGPEVFVHASAVAGEGHKVLHEDEEVEYVLEKGDDGKIRATALTGKDGAALLGPWKGQTYKTGTVKVWKGDRMFGFITPDDLVKEGSKEDAAEGEAEMKEGEGEKKEEEKKEEEKEEEKKEGEDAEMKEGEEAKPAPAPKAKTERRFDPNEVFVHAQAIFSHADPPMRGLVPGTKVEYVE